jgi:hypothetical protein
MNLNPSRRVIRSEVEGRRDVARERRYQERYARRHGYFWMPCPLCSEMFGGHEWRGSGLPDSHREGTEHGICPRCTGERQRAAERHLRELGRSYTFTTSRWGSDQVTHRVGTDPMNPKGVTS